MRHIKTRSRFSFSFCSVGLSSGESLNGGLRNCKFCRMQNAWFCPEQRRFRGQGKDVAKTKESGEGVMVKMRKVGVVVGP